jgi:hypothetical protein
MKINRDLHLTRCHKCQSYAHHVCELCPKYGCKPKKHSYDILGARMLWKPKEARILKNFIDQPV